MVFGVGAVLSGFAGSTDLVIAGRAVQGAGAAFVMPATLSLLAAVFPPEERQRAIAIWVGFAGAGGALGPIVAGALLERYWWGSAFLVNVPVVVLTTVAVAVFSPRSRDDSATPLDPVGAVISLVGLTALLFGIIEGAERGWTDPLVVGAFVLTAVLAWAFVRQERRSAHPMLPLTYFSDRRFSVGSAVITTSFFVMFGWFFLFSLYLQFARGYSPFEAGLATLPFAPVFIVLSPRSAAIAARLGTGRAIALGFGLVGLGMAVLSVVQVDTPYPVLAAGDDAHGGGDVDHGRAGDDQHHGRRADVQGRCGVGGQRHHPRARRRARHRHLRNDRQLAVPHQPRPRRARARSDGQRRGDGVARRRGRCSARRSVATPARH